MSLWWVSIILLILPPTETRQTYDELLGQCTVRAAKLPDHRNAKCCKAFLRTTCFRSACQREGYEQFDCFGRSKNLQKTDPDILECGVNYAFFKDKCPDYEVTELDNAEVATAEPATTTILPTTLHSDQSTPETSNNIALIVGVVLLFVALMAGGGCYYCHGQKASSTSNNLVAYPGKESQQGLQQGKSRKSFQSKLSRNSSQSLAKTRPSKQSKSKLSLSRTKQNKISKMKSDDSFSSRAQITGIAPMSTVGISKGLKIDMSKLMKAVR